MNRFDWKYFIEEYGVPILSGIIGGLIGMAIFRLL